ncbi:MAG: hypothetical protein AAF651_02140 [Cyanobacteria bacterium P01_C01_bin.73]
MLGPTGKAMDSDDFNSEQLAQYIEQTGKITQPWVLLQLRLKKLQERRHQLSEAAYLQELEALHQSLMGMGEWWVGREDDVF